MATAVNPNNNTTPNTRQRQAITALNNMNEKSALNPREFLRLCLVNWPWFVASIIVCLAFGYIYLQMSTPMYEQNASIMIKTDAQGRPISSNATMFQDLGVGTQASFVQDEIAMFTSPDLMRDVVRKLNLDVHYTQDGRFRDIDLYGKQLPLKVVFENLEEQQSASMDVALNKNGNFTITNMKLDGKELKPAEIKGHIGTPLKTPMGTIQVLPGSAYNPKSETELHVSKVPVKAAAAGLIAGLKAQTNENSDFIIDFTMTNSNPERAKDVLTQLILSYNERWIQDKRTLADNSSKFIDERVQLLQSELGSVDNDISSFKSNNLMPDVDAAASMYMSQASSASMALKDLRNQEYMAKYIRNYLRNSDNNNKLLPYNSGLAGTNISGQIAQYNSKILERNSLVNQSSTSNPLVAEMDAALQAMRGALIESIDNELVSIGEQIRSQEGLSGNATSKIASNPKQAKYLLSVERQQKVKESLYLYLLQKREENQLNQAFTSYNTRIIREPDGPNGPISPNGTNIMLVAFAIGLVIPALGVFAKEISVHVVRGRRDIKNMKVPFAGELPLHNDKNVKKASKKSSKHNVPLAVVRENSRNSINEAFRVVRTNVEFMFGNTPNAKVAMLTSVCAGCGKTFVSYNLGKSFAIKNKKVAVVDLDMRKSSLSKYITGSGDGVADYLANRVDDLQSIIHPLEDTPNMVILPVGTVPPNPTELLFNDKFKEMIEYLRAHYDYIFLDCPPVEIVADASIVSKVADYTLFVVRAGVVDLQMLPIIDSYYEEGKFPNMSVILNGTSNPRSRYSSSYGSPFSYGYGYGYGYHYSDD